MWSIGLYFTLRAVKTDITRYFRYESIIHHREFDETTAHLARRFPIVIVCSNNMHARSKLYQFPIINDTILRFLYGAGTAQEESSLVVSLV